MAGGTAMASVLGRHARICPVQRIQGPNDILKFTATRYALFSSSSSAGASPASPLTHPNNLDGNRRHGGMPVGAIQIEASHIQPFKDLVHRVMREDEASESKHRHIISKRNLAFRGVEPFVGPPTLDQARDKCTMKTDTTTSTSTSIAGTKRKRPKQLLVHLPSTVASALDDGHPELTSFLNKHRASYLPGFRRDPLHREATRDRRHAMISTFVAPNPLRDMLTRDMPPNKFTYMELFAGIGGFRLGLDAIGGRCVFANELDPYAANLYRRNFSMNGYSPTCPLVEADILDLCPIRDAIPNDVDVLCAGFPCQAFSVRGDQKALNDERGQLYRELCRILLATRPKSFIFENVAGLVTMEGGHVGRDRSKLRAGKVFEHILSAFRDCGYKLIWNVLNASHFVPQRRKRVYIVGIRQDFTADFSWDWYADIVAGDEKSDKRVLRDILESRDFADAYQLTDSQFETARRIHGNEIYALFDIHQKAPTLISSYRKINSMTTKYILEEADGNRRNRPVRFLTPRECARLMGFPEWYSVPSAADCDVDHAHFYKGIGNAVCPPLVERIGLELVRSVVGSV